jgi:hypothetical protein
MLLSCHQNAGQFCNIKIAKRSSENVAQFKYLGTTVTNENLIQKKIKRRLNSGNPCYDSVQNLLSYRLLSKNVTIRIYKSIILPVVLCGRETCSLTIREEHIPRVFENRVLRRIFGPKSDKVTGSWKNRIMRSFITCTLRQVSLNDQAKKDEIGSACNTSGEKKNAYRTVVGKDRRIETTRKIKA